MCWWRSCFSATDRDTKPLLLLFIFKLSSDDGAVDCDVDGDADIVGEGVDDGVEEGDGDDVVGEGVGDVRVTDRDTQSRLLPFQLSRELARDTPRVHPVHIVE